MKSTIFIFLLNISLALSYYSLKLNKIYLPQLSNDGAIIDNGTIKNLTKEELEDLEEYIDLPLKNTELNNLNQSYIKTKNIKSELYTIDAYIGSNKQYFRLLLSTFDNFTQVTSINCKFCDAKNKYNSSLSNNNFELSNLSESSNYKIFMDSLFINSEKKINEITEKNNITVDNLIFKVMESNNSGFINSNLIDGILSLSYNNNTQIPNNNFIKELYQEGKISSPSFSIIITSSNVNRLYLGDILKNDYIKDYVSTEMNKGECDIINNKWQCKLQSVGYTDFIYISSHEKRNANALVKFDLTQNKLTIPFYYFNFMIVGYRYEKRSPKSSIYDKKDNKYCLEFNNAIYCTCSGKNSFGVISFYFKNNSRLDIDLRDYVYYDKSAFSLKCRVDISLSNEEEFIVGLKGLNNTILSFNLDDNKIAFFHMKKTDDWNENLMNFILVIIFIIVIIIVIIKSQQ